MFKQFVVFAQASFTRLMPSLVLGSKRPADLLTVGKQSPHLI